MRISTTGKLVIDQIFFPLANPKESLKDTDAMDTPDYPVSNSSTLRDNIHLAEEQPPQVLTYDLSYPLKDQ